MKSALVLQFFHRMVLNVTEKQKKWKTDIDDFCLFLFCGK